MLSWAMERNVLYIGKNQSDFNVLYNQAQILDIKFVMETSFQTFDQAAIDMNPMAVIIDIDSIPINNRCLNKLHHKYPQIRLLLLSGQKVHPDLKEAIGQVVYACISNPIDFDEIDFLFKGILDDVS